MTKPFLTRDDAARRLQCSIRQVERYAKAGHLRRIGRGRYSIGDVEALKDKLESGELVPAIPPGQPQPPAREVYANALATVAPVASALDAFAASISHMQELGPILEKLGARLGPPEPEPYYVGVRRAAHITGLPMAMIRAAGLMGKIRVACTGEKAPLRVNRLDLEKL
jgi:hypothetical protein